MQEEWARVFCEKAGIDPRMVRTVAAFRALHIEITGAGYVWIDFAGVPPAGIEFSSLELGPADDRTGVRLQSRGDPEVSFRELQEFADRVLSPGGANS